MNRQLRALLERKSKSVAAMRAITDKASAENRDLTPEEDALFKAESQNLSTINASLDREHALVLEETALAASAATAALGAAGGARVPPGSVVVTDNREEDAQRGFRSFGEFAQVVRSSAGQGGARDERLMIGAAAPTTFGNESAGADGGFLVPPAFSNTIFTHSLSEDALLPYTDNTEISGNSMVFPKDETTPWGTDGVRAYWQSEGTAGTQTKPKISTSSNRLQKLMALIPLTDELLADAVALGSYLEPKIADSMRWKTNEAILFGSGNGVPLGALSGNAAVVQAKDSGQATLTLSALNLANMISRLPMGGSYGRSVWLINNQVLPLLFTLTLGNYPIYMPGARPDAGGFQGSPYGSLLGRPIMVSQHAKAVSAQGDVMLLDLKYYRTITKPEGMQSATSIHLYFDADATAFRTTFRVDGGPKIVNPIAPANGSVNLSPFVQLAAR